MEIRVFNNSVSGLSSAYAGAASIVRVLLGIHSVSTLNTSSTYAIYNNSVSIDGSGSPNGSNSCFQVAGTTGPRFDVRNNIFANFTAAQTGLNVRHNCYNTNSSTLLGGTGTTVNQNDMYIANDAGVSGFIGWNTSLLVGFNPVATFNAAFATQVTAANVSGDPLFFNNNSNLHATNDVLLNGTGSAIPGYITNDLDCNPRVLPQHIGAYLVPACVSGIPTVSITPAGLPCSLQPLNGTTSAITPVYQWLLNGVEIFGATSASYTPTVAGSYSLRVNNSGENCFGVSAAVVVTESPSVVIAPTSASICDGQSVTITSVSGGGAYGASNATSTSDEEILGVTVGTLNNPSICGAVAPGPGSLAFQYSNYTSGVGAPAAPSLNAGATIAFSINIGTCGGIFTSGCSIFIDYNQNGVWENPAERVAGTPAGTNGPYIFAGNFTVPATAKDGITRMRVINVENGTSASIVPVGTYGFGETEDYNVNIVNPLFYSWSPSTGVSSTTILTPTITPVIGTTVYTLTVTDGAGCTSTNTVSITNLGAGDPNPTTTSAGICAGTTGTLSASGLSTLNWYTLPVGGTLVNTGPTYTLAFPATATYYVESFNGICPSGRTPVTITVTANPSTTPTAVPSAICLGGTSQLDAGTFLSGSLTTPLLAGNGASGNAFNVVATNTITLTGFSITSTTVLPSSAQVWYLPGGFAGPTLTSSAGWTLAGTGTVAQGTNSPITGLVTNITIPAGQTYGIVVVSAGSVSYTNGTVFNAPMSNDANLAIRQGCGGAGFGGAFAFSNTPRNFNGTIQYSFGDPNLNFAWSPAGDLNSSTIKSPIATPTTAGPNPYTVTVTNLAGCTSTATVTVSVVAPPVAPTASVVSVPCGNGTASLSASGSGGTFKWYANASGGTALFTGANYSPVIASDTTFYVSETTLAAPFCEGPRTAVFVDIVDPDTITAAVDIPLICSPALVPPTTVTLTATNVSIPQLNQYQYTWTAPVSGGLVTSTGAVVTAVPTATTTYTVTAQQIGNLTVNINGFSPNGNTIQDEITWTIKDASSTTILSGGPYANQNNNVTSAPVLSTNGPFTFDISAGINTNFTNYTVFCDGNVVASGCVRGTNNVDQVECTTFTPVTVPNINGCLGTCNRIKTVTVGVGATPTVAPTGTILIDECDSALVQLNANAVSSNFITVNANIGNGTVQNGTTTQPAPYGNFFDSNRSQMLIRASELSAAGLSAGSSLSEIKFDVVNTNGTLPLEGFTISLGHTGLTALTSGSAVATPSTVFGPVVYTPVVGINTHVFSAPFVWDGVSSIVVNTCHFNVNFTNNCTFNQTITPFVSTTSIVADNASQCAAAPNAVFSQRPNITFTATAGTTVSVSWSPSAGLSSSTVQNPTVKIDGTTTYTVTATENGSGCSATSSVTVNFTPTPIPAAPAALGDVVCGPDIVNLSATAGDINNVLIWTDTIGGQILAVGPTFNPYVTTSGSYYVREVPPIAPVLMNNNIGTSAGFFPDNASFMNFTVTAAEGVIINSVQVSTNAPVSNAPLVIALVNNLGQIVSVLDTFFLSAGGVTALQTINLGLYVPQGSWRLQPILNPNLNVSNTSTLPSTIPGKITVTCFGNVSNPCFPVGFNGLFYNWDVSAPCAGPPTIVNYTVTTPPAGGIASSGGLSFCDTINTTLTAIDSTLSGYDGFTWSPATGLSATTGSSVVVTNVLSSTIYTVVMNNSVSGCNNIATINLTVNPSPSLLLSYTDTTVCTSSPDLTFNSTAAKSSVVPVGNRFNPNFINGQVYGGNTTQRSQMIFTAADLNAAGLIGPTNITSLAYFVVNKLTTTTYNITMSMRADGLIPAAFPSTAHITTGLTPVFNNPAITSTLGWNTYVFNTPFLWDGVSNVLIDQCFIHNIAGFFDIVATSPTSGVSFNALNASACAAITGAFIAAPNQNDRPNVRFTGGNVLYSWSPATGLSSTSVEDPVLTVSALVPNTMNPYILTVTDPISGCQKIDTINVNLLSVPLAPTASGVTRCGFGSVNLTATALGGFTLRWFDAPTGGTQLGTGSPFSYFVGATDTVYVEEYNGGCAGPRTEVIITVTPSPDVTVSATNNPICDGNGPAVLTASSVNPDYIYEWSPATGLSATTGASVNANPLANTTYTVLAIDNLSGCQDTASITVIIGNSIPISGIIPTKSTICIGDSSVLVSGVNITGNYALTSIPFAPITPTGAPTILQNGGILVTPLSAGSADDGTWQNISLPPGFAFNYYGTTPTAVSVSTNGFLTFTANSALSGCCSGQLLPNATTPNDVLAYGWEDWNQTAGTTDVFTNGVAPFRKFVVRSQGIPRFGGTGAPTTVMVVLNETFNTIEMHVTSIVCGAGDITTLGIENAAGTLGVAVPGRNAVAAWTAANEGWLFSPPNPASFAWSPATGLSSTSVSAPTATPATTTTYTVTVINNVSGCTSTSSVTINVLPIPTKPVITGPSVNCGPAILTFTSDAPDTVKWFSDSIGGALLFTGQVYSPLVTATDTFYVERTNGTCINTGGRTQWIITITPPPALTASASINPICENSSTTLSVDAGTVTNYNTYIWAPATGLSATTGSSVVATPLVTTTYTVFGSDATLGDPSCSNIALITVNVNPAPILLSNTVSPALVCSGDSANINLSIQGVGGSGATSTVAFIDFENPLLPSGWSATGLWHVTTACPTGTPPNPTRWAYYGQDGTCTFDNGGTNTGDLTSATFAMPPTAISAKVRFRFVYNGESGVPPTGFDNASVRTSINGGAFTQAASLSTNGSNSTWLASEFNINSAIGGTVALQWNFNTVDGIANTSLGLQIDSVAITYVNPASSFSYAWTPAAGLSSTSVADPEAFPVSTTTYSCTVTNTVTGCTKEFTSTVNVTPLPKPIITPGDTILCVNDNDSYYVHAVDTGAYAGGYPPGTTFEWNDLNGPVLSDSVVVGQNELLNGLVSVTVTLPPVMGSCVGISNTVTLNFQEPETKIFMYQDSVDGCTNFTGELRAENLFGGAPFRYIWRNTMGDTIRDVIGSTSYSGPYDSDGDLILDDFDLDLIPDIYTIYTDTIGGLAVGTYTVYVITNANSPYPPPSCISSNSIALGRTICGLHNGNPPELIDPCICVNNKDEYNRTGPTDGQFQETISMLGGNSPWTLVSLTSGSGRPFSNSVAPVCTGDNLLETTPVTTADIVEVIPDDSSYITFYFFDGDTYTATFLDSNGDTLSISGGGCSYPAAPRTDTAVWICLDSTNINLQDAAFPNGVDPGITLNWWDDSTCVSNPLAYGDLDDIPINYPDIHDVYNPGPNGMGYTIYNFYVSADSVADATCDGVRSMISVYSNTVDAEITSITNVDCNGEATGAIDITVTNGTAPFTFLWSNGSTDEDLSNVVATTYTLMITDSLGCVRMIDVEILENPAFAIGKVITPNMCHGDSTGQIAVYVSGAVPGPGYIYQWSNGATTAINSDLVAGTYTLTVTDSLGCDTIMTFYIFEPTMLDKNMTISQPLCNGQTGSVNIAAFGGTPWSGGGVHAAGYDYSLDGGAAQSSGIFAGISAGTHTVLITDSNGCNLAVVFTITEPAALICDGSVSNAMCNGSSDGMITSNITGGTAPYTYSWSTGATTQSVNNLSAGIYTVTVTDANGCTISCTYTVGEPAAITFSLTACDNIKCFGGSDGKACLNNVAGGTGPYTYQWNTVPVQTTAMATGLTAGTWTVTVTDAMGCMATGNR
ncbi:MAG: hypothetical protein IPO27_09995 [Bacteroidetes bacterium]|nr:hypothetical protein [Bacteroidota bacterium]